MGNIQAFEEIQNLENLGKLKLMIESLSIFIQEDAENTRFFEENEHLKESLQEAIEKMQNVYDEIEQKAFY